MEPILFTNGTFWPAPTDAVGEVRHLLARAGRIQAVGERALAESSGAAQVDLGGRVAIPGPVDAHCHLVSYGLMRTREADLRGVRSLAEMASRVRGQAERTGVRAGTGRWLLGRGFEQDLLAEGRWPTRHDLDAIASDVPLRITRVCGHALVANSAALRLAGLDPQARENGFPEGVLTENAQAPVYAALPQPSADEWRRAALHACEEAVRVGFVGIHSLMAHGREVRALVDLNTAGALPLRVTMQLPYSLLESTGAAGFRTGYGNDFLRIGAIKLFSDGSLGARTAALREPYTDDPTTMGQLIYSPEDLAARVLRVYESGFQVCIHAIGDRAMDVTLDAIEAAAAAHPAAGPPRIEHASMVDASIVDRMRRLGVTAAVQPQFAWSDYWAPERLGPERVRGCYAFRTLWEAGIPLAGSTDCPVERLDAMAALGQAVHRPSWSPQEALPLEVAVRIFSEGAHALLGRRGGRFQPGDFADFVVLQSDPRSALPAELPELLVGMTVVGGQIRHGS
jgi:predicted amidohydrolase YtcJ